MKNVTVLIPTYNHGHVLSHQIDCLLQQSSPPKRLVILDDGSTDCTKMVLDRYLENKLVKTIRHEENLGLHAAHDRLLNEVETEFFAFAAADDLLTIDWCTTTASLLEKHKDAKMVISNSFVLEPGRLFATEAIDPIARQIEGVYTPTQYISQLLKRGRFPPSNTILYRSNIIEELIRPIFARKELGPLTDVLLMLAIGSRYPVAYSTSLTGASFRNSEGYGGAFFNKNYLIKLIENVELFSKEHIPDRGAENFVIDFAKYTWAKQMILNSMKARRKSATKLSSSINLLIAWVKLLVAYITYGRFKFFNFNMRRSMVSAEGIKDFFHASAIERFDRY